VEPPGKPGRFKRAALVSNLKVVEVELAHLVRAVVNGGEIPTLVAAMHEAEERKARIADQLDALDRAVALRQLDVKALEPQLRERLRDWSGLLARHPLQARQILKKLVPTRLSVTPDFETRRYTFSGHGRLESLVQGLIPEAENHLNVWWPHGIRTRVSVTTTFSPIQSSSCKATEPRQGHATKTRS